MPIAIITTLMGLLGKIPSLLTGINIPGLLSGLFSNIMANWKVWLVGLLVALQLGTGYGWYHDHEGLLKERAAHQLDITNFKNAQAAADKAAQTEKVQLQTESKAAKNEADTNYSSLLSQYDASLVRYAAGKGHTVTGSDNQLPAAQGSDGSSTSTKLPEIIVITGDDGQICAENTARLQASHDWAIQQLAVEKKEQ